MAQIRQTEAFILRTVEYGERDLIATVYGRDTGKFSAIAKNARSSKRRFGGGLQPMRKLELRYVRKPNRDLARLEDIDVARDYRELEADFDKIAVASYATELLREAVGDLSPSPPTFELASDFYERTASAEPDTFVLEVLLRHFQLRLFELCGSPPALQQCFRCGRPATAMSTVYAIRTGEGVICRNCVRTGEGVGMLYPASLRLLNYFRRPTGTLPDLEGEVSASAALDQARRFVEASTERVVDGELRSAKTLQTIMNDEL